jgi:NitT/TauT family transport system substrate-binding protein
MDFDSMTRRQLLGLAGTLTLTGLLAACGASASPSAPASAAAKPSTAAGSAAPVGSAPATPASAAGKPAASASAKPAASGVSGSASGKPAASAAAKPSGSGPALTVAYVAPVAPMAPLWMADATKAFADHGVNVTVRLIQANAAVPALIAKEVDALEISAAPVITADLNGQAELVYIASCLNHSTFVLVVKNDIKTAADLKGKTIASDRPGTPTDYGLQAALGLLKLQASDVQVRALGSSNVILQAMLSGQVDGGLLGQPESFQAETKGFHVIQDTFGIPYQNTGMVAQKSRLEQLAPAMPGFLAGLRDGIQTFNQKPDVAVKVLQDFTKESDTGILKQTYDLHHDRAPFQADLQPTLEGIKAMASALAATVPAAKDAKPEQFVDLRFLSK